MQVFRNPDERSVEVVNLAEKFNLIQEYWQPKLAGQINNFAIKLVKFQGEFVWHQHVEEDEMFLVIKGSLVIKLRD